MNTLIHINPLLFIYLSITPLVSLGEPAVKRIILQYLVIQGNYSLNYHH